MRRDGKKMSILSVNEKGQLCTFDSEKKDSNEYIYNKIGDCSNGMGVCLGFNPMYINKNTGW